MISLIKIKRKLQYACYRFSRSFSSEDPTAPDSYQLALAWWDYLMMVFSIQGQHYSDNQADPFLIHQVMQSMTISDTTKSKVPPAINYKVPASPTVLASTTTCITSHALHVSTIICRRTDLIHLPIVSHVRRSSATSHSRCSLPQRQCLPELAFNARTLPCSPLPPHLAHNVLILHSICAMLTFIWHEFKFRK